jgi:hypothetical protein
MIRRLEIRICTAFLLTCICCLPSYAQLKVGNNPGTINADAMLDIEATDKGVLIPRIALTSTNLAAPLVNHISGMIIYNTATAGTGITAVTPGVYYNDGTEWLRIAGVLADGTRWTNNTATNLVELTNLSDGLTQRSNDNVFIINDAGNVGIGTDSAQVALKITRNTGNTGTTIGDFKGTHNENEFFRYEGNEIVGDVNAVSFGMAMRAVDNDNADPGARMDFRISGGQFPGNNFGSRPNFSVITITSQTRVGINNQDPQHTFDLTGGARKSSGGTAWLTTSDIRLKENIKPYTRGLKEILQINPVYYSYTDASGLNGHGEPGQEIGIIAQELQEIIPEAISAVAVHKMKDGTGIENVLQLSKADAMWFALINAVKEQQASIVSQDNETKQLREELIRLRQEMAAIKKSVEAAREQ